MHVEDLVAAYGERLDRLRSFQRKMKDPPEESAAEEKLTQVLMALDAAIDTAESIELAPVTVHMGTDDGTVPLCYYGGYPAGDRPVRGDNWPRNIPTRYCAQCAATYQAIHKKPLVCAIPIERTKNPVVGVMPNHPRWTGIVQLIIINPTR
jgi:hypothetical protein